MPRKHSTSPSRKTVVSTVARKPLSSQPPSAVAQPKSSFLSMIKEGFGFGLGSSIARNVVDSVMAPKTTSTQVEQSTKQEAPLTFAQCMTNTAGNYEECGHLE